MLKDIQEVIIKAESEINDFNMILIELRIICSQCFSESRGLPSSYFIDVILQVCIILVGLLQNTFDLLSKMQLIDKYCWLNSAKKASIAEKFDIGLNSYNLANEIKKRLQQRYNNYIVSTTSSSDNKDICFLENDNLIAMQINHRSHQLYDFQLFVTFNLLMQVIQIKAQLTHNGIPIAMESFSRIMLGLNIAANLNKLVSPVKVCLNPKTGALSLEANVFIEETSKQKDEVASQMTNKIAYLITLIEQNRDILLFLFEEKLKVSASFAKKYTNLARQFKQAQSLISTLQTSLFSMNLDIFDSQRSINYELKRQEFSKKYEPFTEQTEQVLQLFSQNLRTVGGNLAKLSNEQYGDFEIELCKGKLQQKIQSQILTRVYLVGMEEWISWNCLSSGGYGKIQIAQVNVHLDVVPRNNQKSESNEAEMTLQIIRKSDKRKIKESRVVHQKEIIKNLKDKAHPNIATFLELIPMRLRNRSHEEISEYLQNQRYVYLQFQQNTSLDSFMRKNECFSLYSKIFTLEQAAKGLLFLHKESIVHIDFKPANIFIGKHCLAKVGDFGQSLHLGSTSLYHNATTFPYSPPEVERDFQLTEKADVYSFGVTLFECLFESNVKKPMQERYSLRKSSGNKYVQLPYIQPQRIKQYGNKRVISILSFLCLRCINVEAKQRPSMAWIVTILEYCRLYLELLYSK